MKQFQFKRKVIYTFYRICQKKSAEFARSGLGPAAFIKEALPRGINPLYINSYIAPVQLALLKNE